MGFLLFKESLFLVFSIFPILLYQVFIAVGKELPFFDFILSALLLYGVVAFIRFLIWAATGDSSGAPPHRGHRRRGR